MTRKIGLALVAALLLSSAPALAADSDGKVSGRLVDIRPDGKLMIEEQGPWKGPGTGLSMRTVDITPDTSIRVVRPKGRWEPTDAVPGYDVEPADFRALKSGDLVTVTTNGRSTAVAIDVVRPEGADAGLASPRSDSEK
jgi:hypothetical protein